MLDIHLNASNTYIYITICRPIRKREREAIRYTNDKRKHQGKIRKKRPKEKDSQQNTYKSYSEQRAQHRKSVEIAVVLEE